MASERKSTSEMNRYLFNMLIGQREGRPLLSRQLVVWAPDERLAEEWARGMERRPEVAAYVGPIGGSLEPVDREDYT